MGWGVFSVLLHPGEMPVEMLNHSAPTVTQQLSSAVKKLHPLVGLASPKSLMPPRDPPGTIVALPPTVSVGFVFLVKTSVASVKCCWGRR